MAGTTIQLFLQVLAIIVYVVSNLFSPITSKAASRLIPLRCAHRQIQNKVISPVNVDVIKEPLIGVRGREQMRPQIFHFMNFLHISSWTDKSSDKVPYLYHVTHKEYIHKMMNDFDKTLNFKGKEMVFYRSNIEEYASYIGVPIQNHLSLEMIDSESIITPLTGIKLCHFSAKPLLNKGYSIYGDCMFRIPYDVMMKRYLEVRREGKDECTSIVYRVACTQIYRYEINHIILVCCKGDKALDAFPAIGESENQTQYFMPIAEDTPTGTSYSAEMSEYMYNNKRHENLTLSLYLPGDCQLSLSQEGDYTETPVGHKPKYCLEKFKRFNFSGQCPRIRKKD